LKPALLAGSRGVRLSASVVSTYHGSSATRLTPRCGHCPADGHCPVSLPAGRRSLAAPSYRLLAFVGKVL